MAASGGQPLFKKVKTCTTDEEFLVTFHDQHLHRMKDAVLSMDFPLSGYGAGVTKIKHCNALSSKCFSVATCDCEELRETWPDNNLITDVVGYKLNGIFQYGFDILDAYTRSSKCIPGSKGARIALIKLLKVLSEIEILEKTLSHNLENAKETEWTARIAHHLLSKLAVSPSYTLDNISKEKTGDLECPCGCKEKLSGTYGDTSIGVPCYWHGRTDILMDVAVTVATDEPDSPGAGNNSSNETKATYDRMVECKEQIRARTIVFSFLQKRRHPELENFLIPTIAVSKSKVAVCMYDCENDIFLETPRFDLFLEGKILKAETIVALWLVLNYRYCCSGVPEEILETNFKADFFKHTGSFLEKYVSNVSAPCNYQPEQTWIALRYVTEVKKKKKNVNDICEFSQ